MIIASFWLVFRYALMVVACVGVGYLLHLILSFFLDKIAREKARVFLEERRATARRRIAQARQQARQESDSLKHAAQVEIDEDRETLREFESRLQERAQDVREKEDYLGEKAEELDGLRREARGNQIDLRGLRRRIGRVRAERRKILLGIVDRTEEEFQSHFLEKVSMEVDREASRFMEQQIQVIEEEAETRARNVVDRAVQRMQISHNREDRPGGVVFGNPELLEACGFQPGSPSWLAFQEATGVETVLDSENGCIVFNSMDGVRREAARRALVQILGVEGEGGATALPDGGAPAAKKKPSAGTSRPGGQPDRGGGQPWTPEAIGVLVERTTRDLRRVLNRKGRKAAQALNLPGNNRLFEYLGRLSYRTSYGQNILKHSQEVGFLGGMLGAEVGLETKLAKRCAFLHDIGKCMDFEVEGGHPEIGARLARECGENDVVVNAVEAHHDDVPRISLFPLVVQAADAISGARPGARRRTAEKYLLRMGQIEDIANNKPGVESAYVIQAGREVRVILDAENTTDQNATEVAHAIARELEAEMNFPGKIKVTVIREQKVSAIAS